VFFTCIALYFGVLHAAAQAQPNVQPGPPPAAASGDLRDKPEGLIKLDVMVTDGTGKPVPALMASDFRLFENGREQKILSFQAFTGQGAGTEPPVKVILLIDTLNIPPELAREERYAVTFYLRKNGGQLARPTSVFLLSETGLWTVSKPSMDGNALAREIEHNDLALVPRNGGGPRGPAVPGYSVDPIEYALQALGHIAADERRQPGRKLMIWVGPGWGIGTGAIDNMRIHSDLFGTICWFSTLLREAHLALYSFSVGEPETDLRANLYRAYLAGVTSHRASMMNLNRKVLALQSGGRVIDAGVDIVDEIENCVRETGRFYRITFDPFAAEHPDEYHDLKVEVDEPGLNARTSTGFYDQPYYSTDQIPPLKRVSLEELQKILELDESDAMKAHQLIGLELTARLSERRLASLYAIVHGKRTRQQLRILADASSFLDPPADEILAAPPPSPDQQQHMISMASSYLTGTIDKLPDFFARRITTRYQETAMFLKAGVNYQPLHQTDSSTTTVRYRHGREESDAKSHGMRLGNPEMITLGEFGPALEDVFDAIEKHGRLTWIRWEKATAGPVAVFRSAIPSDQSLHYVWACCLPDGDGTQAYQRYAGYHIEIAIDPDNGAILRLSFQFDLKSTSPLTRSDIMIEYGPVEIGGKTYDCPLRSVSIMRSRSVGILSEWDESFRTYGPYATMLNDVSFDRYHMFRSESRILPGFTPEEK
jgi:VWFA-related protein